MFAKVNSLAGLISGHKKIIQEVKKTGKPLNYNAITIDSLNRDVK